MKGLKLISPLHWKDYELIDCGGLEKLERFGRWSVRRPEPQALWKKSLDAELWDRADASFLKEKGSEDRGEWRVGPGMPQQWSIEYGFQKRLFSLRLGLTAFKHVGVFPEQAENWDYIYNCCHRLSAMGHKPKVLNLFAYTGGATLAALASGAQVTHVDSVKQVVNWASENAQNSSLDGARWIVDDAMKFAQRELKRGNLYEGIILDPPAYGRGPDGERWILEEGLPELIEICARLLVKERGFFVLNLYSMGLSALLAKGLTNSIMGEQPGEEFGELYITDRSKKALPLGVFYRFNNNQI